MLRAAHEHLCQEIFGRLLGAGTAETIDKVRASSGYKALARALNA